MEAPDSPKSQFLEKKLHLGSSLQTPRGTKLFVLSCIDDGNTSPVYNCQTTSKQLVAIKIVRQDNEQNNKSISAEQKKYAQVRSLSLLAPAVFEEGIDHVVREWVEGVRGDAWFHQWVLSGRPAHSEAFRALVNLWVSVSNQGFYVQNTKALNLLWTQEGWVVVDSGYKKNGEPETCMLRFCSHFDRKWQEKHLDKCSQCSEFAFVPVHHIILLNKLYVWKNLDGAFSELEVLTIQRKADREERKRGTTVVTVD